jgi:hypothetical protein
VWCNFQYYKNNGKTATARRGPTKCTILQISIAPKTFPSGEGGAEGDERGAAQGCDNIEPMRKRNPAALENAGISQPIKNPAQP